MRHFQAAALAAVLLPAAPAFSDEALSAAVAADYDAYLEALYQHLHQNPELSFQEVATAARMAEELRGLGFTVTEGVGAGEGRNGGVVGVLENGEGPTLLIRTDLDALPVEEPAGLAYASRARGVTLAGEESFVMHACGHDLHMTAFVGTARQLVERRGEWAGTLVMIGQPAEEIGLGAKAMIDDGLYERFPRPDWNLALHDAADLPAGQVAATAGWALANVDTVDLEIHGVGGHGAYPHTTKDPVVIAAQTILALQTLVSRETSPIDSAVVTVGSIHGGTKHNIVPDSVHLQLTVRSYEDETRARLLSGVERVARAQALSAGLPEDRMPEMTVEETYTPSTYNDPGLTERALAAIAAQVGAENVVARDPVMGGEDFSQYGRTDPAIPSLLFWVGAVEPERFAAAQAAGETLPSLHSALFQPEPRLTITTAVEAMTAAALDLLAPAGG
jgi:hippurate hydrolase